MSKAMKRAMSPDQLVWFFCEGPGVYAVVAFVLALISVSGDFGL